MRSDYGKLGCPTETTVKRRQKDVDSAYQAVLKSRKEGLSRAEALLRECVVKSERGKVKIDKCRGYIEEAIAEFDETYRKYSGR